MEIGYSTVQEQSQIMSQNQIQSLQILAMDNMELNEYLSIFIRSSLAFKKGLMLANSTGIIDCDYYNNPDNEGHIMIAYYNTKDVPYTIKKGERIAQGIFMKYLTTDNDDASGIRMGGIGSTGQ